VGIGCELKLIEVFFCPVATVQIIPSRPFADFRFDAPMNISTLGGKAYIFARACFWCGWWWDCCWEPSYTIIEWNGLSYSGKLFPTLSYSFVPPQPDTGVCVYSETDYKGASACFQDGSDGTSLDSGLNDKISSVKVFGGSQVILYKDGYNSEFLQIKENQANLGISYPAWDNTASSLQVRPSTWTPPQVCVYTEPDYKGSSSCYEDGSDIGGLCLEDEISSVKVPDGLQVVLYKDRNFKGGFQQIKTDQANLGISYPGWDNVASSLQVRRICSLKFDGSDDYVDLGNWFNYQKFTISMWLKAGSSQVAYANILDNNHTDARSWVIQQDGTATNQYSFAIAPGGGRAISFKLESVFSFLAITFDGATSTLYLNGNLIGSTTGRPPIIYDGTESLRIGAWGHGGRNWNGEISNISIWNTAHSQSEIQNNMYKTFAGNEPGLVSYYRFYYCSGTTLPDIAGGKHNGTLKNMQCP